MGRQQQERRSCEKEEQDGKEGRNTHPEALRSNLSLCLFERLPGGLSVSPDLKNAKKESDEGGQSPRVRAEEVQNGDE